MILSTSRLGFVDLQAHTPRRGKLPRRIVNEKLWKAAGEHEESAVLFLVCAHRSRYYPCVMRPWLPTLLGCSLLLAHVLPAVEPWTDDQLPVQEGLQLWFDCSHQNAARSSLKLPGLSSDITLDYLFDGSGRARHLAQQMQANRPRFRLESSAAFLSFDGIDDALLGSSLRGEMTNVTIFIVAAPQSNQGGFRGFFGCARAGQNDYSSGLNFDFAFPPTPDLSYLNIEGSGAGGVAQLLQDPPMPFGPWHVFSIESQAGEQSVRLFLDGKAQGARGRRDSVIGLDEFALGARHFSNSGELPYTQGFFHGDIAEFLLYGHLLTAPERSAVEQYLTDKYARLLKAQTGVAEALRPLEAAPLEIKGEPPPRKRPEIEALLASADAAGSAAEPGASPFRIVLCAGPKDHGPGEHDYPLWQKRWSRLLALAENVQVAAAWEWPAAEQFQASHAIIFYSDNPGWNQARAAELDAYLARGGGAMFVHYAVDGHDQVEALAQRIGLAWRGGASKFRHGPLDLKLEPSPLTAGLGPLHFVDESYWNLVGDPAAVQLVASGLEEGASQPLVWTHAQGKGRVCVNILGHYTWTFDDPLFRILLLRGICWSAHQPVDRLSRLALVGARVED